MGDRYPDRAIGMGAARRSSTSSTDRSTTTSPSSTSTTTGRGSSATAVKQPGCKNDIGARAQGARGHAELSERRRGIRLRNERGEWTFEGPENRMYQSEHDALFAAIRAGTPLNHGEYIARSTLLEIMGRMAAYTGQQVTWEMA